MATTAEAYGHALAKESPFRRPHCGICYFRTGISVPLVYRPSYQVSPPYRPKQVIIRPETYYCPVCCCERHKGETKTVDALGGQAQPQEIRQVIYR